MSTTQTATATIYVCMSVIAGKYRQAGHVEINMFDYSTLYPVETAKEKGEAGYILLTKQEISFDYKMPDPSEIAELAMPHMEEALKAMRAKFYLEEQKLLADIAKFRTLAAPLEGDFIPASDITPPPPAPRKDDDALDVPF